MIIKKLQLAVLLFLLSFFSKAQNIYVATNGNDNNNGTINSPYKTFNKAVSVMTAGDVCIIRGGVYEEELVINKNGTASNYLTFKAATNETVEIRATTKVAGWELHSGNIYKATGINMTIPSRFRAVYHNENYMDLARWPNNTDNNRWTLNSQLATGGGPSHFLANNIPNIDWTGGLVYYLAPHSGTSWTRTITSSTTNKINHAGVNITNWPFSNHHPQHSEGNIANPHGQLYLFNKLEALDHAREWYYDSANQTLYFQSATGAMPAANSVEYAVRKNTAKLNGDYIKIEGLTFFGGSILIPNGADNNQVINCKVTHGSEGHDDLTNTSAQVGEASIEVLGDNTLIKNCIINHSSTNGILIAGWAAANCTIEGNTISNMDYLGIHAAPIRTSADGTNVLKNTIFNTGRDGMYVAGSNCIIAYNDISASQKINSDSGVFYTVGNANLKNSEIHHNWIHDATAPSYSHNPGSTSKAAGIYLDNDSKGYLVHHNVVWNVSWSGYQVNWNNTNLNFYHNTIWNAGRAMDSWVNGHVQESNKIYNNYANTGTWHTETATDFDIQNSPIFTGSPLEDPTNLNFMPKAGSALIDQAPAIPGFFKSFTGSAADIGAYERGGTAWTAGINAIEDNEVTLSIDTATIENSELRLFPNPVVNVLTLNFTNSDSYENANIIIYSLLGHKIISINNKNRPFQDNINIPVTNLSPGIYLVTISTINKTITKKFIKR
ncbi:right-handed parallel beta-helix repeat-containing protein [Olleya sp. HaHaR_3_96]|uniref:T9SS type A sorting domain-containing protein n=1 Tax=Olleya sp. HaHaR_3_96 TaxID=2745560 RepID=UPI001C4F932D|nr:right-handed parallel beta-helix repeat-containing protein [Olleya sp. HaHaR_3_96]QXP61126.1 right-handed parallel beta-helix repeat-containing protein [Olleya sp. HaHaR_3_96]